MFRDLIDGIISQAQDSSKYSQIVSAVSSEPTPLCSYHDIFQASGLGSASCSYKQTGNDNNYIVITCVTDTLTQYVGLFLPPN